MLDLEKIQANEICKWELAWLNSPAAKDPPTDQINLPSVRTGLLAGSPGYNGKIRQLLESKRHLLQLDLLSDKMQNGVRLRLSVGEFSVLWIPLARLKSCPLSIAAVPVKNSSPE